MALLYISWSIFFLTISLSSMKPPKATRLRLKAFRFQGGGKLSKGRDLNVDYVAYLPNVSETGKKTCIEVPAASLYETSPERPSSSTSSPRKRVKEVPAESGDVAEEDGLIPFDERRRNTKVCLSTLCLIIFSYFPCRLKMISWKNI